MWLAVFWTSNGLVGWQMHEYVWLGLDVEKIRDFFAVIDTTTLLK